MNRPNPNRWMWTMLTALLSSGACADVSVGGQVQLSLVGSFGSTVLGISGDGTIILGNTDTHRYNRNNHYQDSSALAGTNTSPSMPDDYTTEEGSIIYTNYPDHGIVNNNLVFIPSGGYTATNISLSRSIAPTLWNTATQSEELFLEDSNIPRYSDGSFVVENSNLSFYLGNPIIQYSTGISGNGSVVIGESVSLQGTEAFIWREEIGLVSLNGKYDGILYSTATAVNNDGTVIVGARSASGRPTAEAYHWTEQTGAVLLGKISNKPYSTATDVSHDGNVVIGVSGTTRDIGLAPDGIAAFRWTKQDGLVDLGGYADFLNMTATSTNRDGSIIVGAAYSIDEDKLDTDGYQSAIAGEAYMWRDSEAVGLGHIKESDYYSGALLVTPDGSVVIGISSNSMSCAYPATAIDPNHVCFLSHEAFRWNSTQGMQSIPEWLGESGYTVPANIILQSPTGVSDDGTVVIGNHVLVEEEGVYTRVYGPWVARGDRGFISVADFTESFSSTASIPKVSSSLPAIALHGAHHQPLLAQQRLSKQNCAWVNGDFANYQEKKADSTLAEVGFCKDLQEGIRGGIGIGKSKVDQTLDYSGSSVIDGKYLLAELDYQLPESPVLLSTTILHGNWNADINRGYLNAGAEDQSRGITDIKATAVRVRADWRELYTVDDTTFTPKIEYTLTKSDVDGYTETTGGFPARFDSQSHISRESRIGVIAERDLDALTTVRGIAEAVHRFDKSGAAFSGEVIDMFPFSIPGGENRQDWVRVGGEVDYQIDKDSFVSASLMRSSRGEDAEVSGAVSWRIGF